MKHVTLVRHSKTEALSKTGKDHDRELTVVGVERAREMARRLKDSGMVPDAFYTSSAARAHETAVIFAEVLHGEGYPVTVVEELYYGSPGEYLAVIQGFTAGESEHAAYFGHNPTISSLLNELSKEGNAGRFKPCEFATFGFDVGEWADVERHGGGLEQFVGVK